VRRTVGLVVSDASSGDRVVEDLQDLCAEASGKNAMTSESILSGYATLLVGRGSKRQVALPEEPVMCDQQEPGDGVTSPQGPE
jgi:hypothetical protein